MDPARLPPDWPNSARARMQRAGARRFWVIDTAPDTDAPALLLLHGTGASGHSFRRTIAGLEGRWRLIVPDLPGQGCSPSPGLSRLGLDAMAADLWALCDAMALRPAAIIGHSAGAAIGLRMAEMRPPEQGGPMGVIGINAALGAFDGAAGVLFPLLARGLAYLPLAARAVAALSASPATIARVLAKTGSPLDPEGRAFYLRLMRDPDHVAGTVGMMAEWRLDGLMARLPRLARPVWLIASRGDHAVPVQVSAKAAKALPRARLICLPDLGHLAHEEAPDGLSAQILACLDEMGRLGAEDHR